MPTPKPIALLLIAAAFAGAAGTARAQAAAPPSHASMTAMAAVAVADAARRDATAPVQAGAPSGRRHDRAPLIGAVIGGAAATALTAWASQAYGNNEIGRFCGVCFVRWGTFAIPVGAGIGAGVGLAVQALGSDTPRGPGMPPTTSERSPASRTWRRGVGLSVTF